MPNYIPMKDNNGAPRTIVQIACGKSHSMALTHDGVVLAWGHGKSGQLASTNDKIKTPEVIMSGVKSIAAGGNSSCCVTSDHRLLVWGELISYLKLGNNLCVPTQWSGTGGSGTDEKPAPVFNEETQAATPCCGGFNVAATIEHEDPLEEFDIICTRLKHRQNALNLKKRTLGWGAGIGKKSGGRQGGIEELRDMNTEIENKQIQTREDIANTKERLGVMKTESERILRCLAIRDQQGGSLQEVADKVERHFGELSHHDKAAKRKTTSKLIDLTQFKTSISSSKGSLLEQYSELESNLAAANSELQNLMETQQALVKQHTLMKQLASGMLGTEASLQIDKALKIAGIKIRELQNASPFILAKDGAFSGLREILVVSDRALGDISSALKEISAVCTSRGDAHVLERLLEVNLKLRKGLNELITGRIFRSEQGHASKVKGEMAKGLVHYFKEASSAPA